MTSTLWRALDEIPAASTDLRDWREILGVEFSRCHHFLRSTGSLAKEIGCPSPSGDGCPRRVVRLEDGRFRAVCGQSPAECDPLNLSQPDIAVFSIDRMKLGTAIARAFRAEGQIRDDGDWIIIGRHAVSAAAGIDIAFITPRGLGRLESLPPNFEDKEDWVFVVPSTQFLKDADPRWQAHRGGLVVGLADVASIDDEGQIRLDVDLDVLFLPFRERLLAGEREKRIWVLPAGTRWEELTFELISEEVINVKYKNETRRFEPEQLRMKHRRSGRITVAWSLLRVLAEGGGSMPRGYGSIKQTDPRKQKQLLSSRLRDLFGLPDDPIVYRPLSNCYEARFVIRDSRPRHASSADR